MTMSNITLTSEITVRLVQSMGGDHSVVAAAKVSTTGEDALRFADPEHADGNAGLINYLMKHRHGTPFEHASLTFFVHAPAFVWWEWVRHRIGHSYNLESSRYKALDPVFWIPRRDRKMVPAQGHKSARPRFQAMASDDLYENVVSSLTDAYRRAYQHYKLLLWDRGGDPRYAGDFPLANEVARAVLPFAIYFSGWVTVNPRSLMAFLSLRTHEQDATFTSFPQAEIEEAARVTEQFLAEGWPLTHAAFNKNGRVGP